MSHLNTINRIVIFVLLSLFVFSGPSGLSAQGGFHFGIKAGPTMANQTWNNSERRMLLAYHGNVFIESLDPNDRGALFASLGMHTRGSSIRSFGLTGSAIANEYRFQNASLMVGARKKIASGLSVQPYYLVGLRAEYTISDNLEEAFTCFNLLSGAFFCTADPIFVRRFNYGLTFGGGFEFSGGEFFHPCLELSISPDASFQYDRPETGGVNTSGGVISGARVRNLSFEVSLVLKFKREVIYTD